MQLNWQQTRFSQRKLMCNTWVEFKYFHLFQKLLKCKYFHFPSIVYSEVLTLKHKGGSDHQSTMPNDGFVVGQQEWNISNTKDHGNECFWSRLHDLTVMCQAKMQNKVLGSREVFQKLPEVNITEIFGVSSLIGLKCLPSLHAYVTLGML